MFEQFLGFTGYSEEEFQDLWENALFAIDTNVLIYFYKYSSSQSSEVLFETLKWLKENNKLWIPHQVALEYFFNHEEKMAIQKDGYIKLESEFIKIKAEAKSKISRIKSEYPFIETDDFQFFVNDLEKSLVKLNKKIEEKIEKLPDSKLLQDDILNLMDGIIGDPFSQKRVDEIENEGEMRYKHCIPPGFKDLSDKSESSYRNYGDFKYQPKYGDLLIWKQIIDKAKKCPQESVIFITEDRKEDWWDKNGRTIKRPHPQLIQEFFNETKKKSYIYRIENFIENLKNYLKSDITVEQVLEVTSEVESIRKAEDFRMTSNAPKNIEIDKLFGYLSTDEKERIDDMLEDAYSLKNSSALANFRYNNTISVAIRTVIPKLEMNYKHLNQILFTFDYENGIFYKSQFEKLPTSEDERTSYLMVYIDDMKKIITYHDFGVFPDSQPI